MFWWTCPVVTGNRVCLDRMQASTDPRDVERDRDAHLEAAHPCVAVQPELLRLSYWTKGAW